MTKHGRAIERWSSTSEVTSNQEMIMVGSNGGLENSLYSITKETCWTIHGKPADWKSAHPSNDRESRGNLASIDESHIPSKSSQLSREQMELLQKMFSHWQQTLATSVIRIGLLAQKGNFLNALNVKREKINPWIVDSGASDHMIGNANLFHKYRPFHENFATKIADESLSKVARTGSP